MKTTLKISHQLVGFIERGEIVSGDVVVISDNEIEQVNGESIKDFSERMSALLIASGAKITNVTRGIRQPTPKPDFRDDPETGRMYRNDDLFSPTEVETFLGVSRSTLKRLRLTDDFPKPIVFSERIIKWTRDDLDAWVKTR